jgi:hypothetical protein
VGPAHASTNQRGETVSNKRGRIKPKVTVVAKKTTNDRMGIKQQLKNNIQRHLLAEIYKV